ncbi:hypothetical protein [Sulfitobacter sediminis]
MITPAPLGLFLAVILGLVLALILVFARAFPENRTRVTLALLCWIALTGALPVAFAAAGLPATAQFASFAATLLLVMALAVTGTGARVVQANGLALLAAIQCFRLPLEIVLIRWYEAGFMPLQMTWRGDNLDILTGCLALPAALLIARDIRPRAVAFAFNALGLAMLLRIIWIVALSSPTPLRALLGGYEGGPDVLVGLYFPSVWIASVGVASAMFLHLTSLAHLLRSRQTRPAPVQS